MRTTRGIPFALRSHFFLVHNASSAVQSGQGYATSQANVVGGSNQVACMPARQESAAPAGSNNCNRRQQAGRSLLMRCNSSVACGATHCIAVAVSAVSRVLLM